MTDQNDAERDKAERTKAALTHTVAGMRREQEENWLIHLELATLRAKKVFANYEAFVKAGFTPAQALDLCWRVN